MNIAKQMENSFTHRYCQLQIHLSTNQTANKIVMDEGRTPSVYEESRLQNAEHI